jgi:hypothetical protein
LPLWSTLAGIDERMNHVTADIAGAAGDQDRHAVRWLLDGASSLREALRIPVVLDASMGLGRHRQCQRRATSFLNTESLSARHALKRIHITARPLRIRRLQGSTEDGIDAGLTRRQRRFLIECTLQTTQSASNRRE